MAFLLSRISTARRYLPLVTSDTDSSDEEASSPFYIRAQQLIRSYCGPVFSVIVFLVLLSALSFVAAISNIDGSPFKNENELILSPPHVKVFNHSSFFDHEPTVVFNATINSTSYLHINGTVLSHPTRPGDPGELGVLTVAFFTLLTTWAVIQTLKISRSFSAQRSLSGSRNLQRDIELSRMLNSYMANTAMFDDNFRRRLRMTLIQRDFNSNDYDLLQQLDEELMNGQSAAARARGARQDVIDQLPSHTHSHNENEADTETRCCSICLGPFEEGDSVRTLLCLHQFHQNCVDNWLRQNASCPICKASIRHDT